MSIMYKQYVIMPKKLVLWREECLVSLPSISSPQKSRPTKNANWLVWFVTNKPIALFVNVQFACNTTPPNLISWPMTPTLSSSQVQLVSSSIFHFMPYEKKWNMQSLDIFGSSVVNCRVWPGMWRECYVSGMKSYQ